MHQFRSLIAPSAAVVALALMLATSIATAAPRVMRISVPSTPEDWHTKMLYVLRAELARRAPGAFDVQIYHSATLFKQGTEVAAMARGNLDLALISMQDIAKRLPEYSLFTAGYLIRDPAHQQRVFNGPIGHEIYRKVSDAMDLQVLQVAYLGTRQLNLRDVRPVRTPADLAGVKLRMPGSKEWLFLGEALGANPTPLAFSEVYLGLKTGAIDAQDNPLPTIRSAKFYEVTRQIVLTGHLVDGLFLVIANKTWKALTPEQQGQLQAAAAAAVTFNNENRLRDEQQLLEFFKQQGLTVTTPDVAAFRRHVQQQYLASELARAWPPGMLERVNAVK